MSAAELCRTAQVQAQSETRIQARKRAEARERERITNECRAAAARGEFAYGELHPQGYWYPSTIQFLRTQGFEVTQSRLGSLIEWKPPHTSQPCCVLL